MNLTIDPGVDLPLQRQVYAAIRAEILAGRLQSGDRLPATRSLAEELGVSRQTVTGAYEQLRTEGYVEGRPGAGTFVAADVIARREAGTSRDIVPLSRWGRRLPSFSGNQPSLPLDLRPHRIAADAFPWEAWDAAVGRADRSALLAPDPAGFLPLRRAIAEHVHAYRSVNCRPEQVVVASGSTQGLSLLAQLVVEDGERVVVEDPGYPAARLSLAARGAHVLRVPVDDDGLIVDRLVEADAPRLIHVTPSHQDPTGATLSLRRRLALLEYAASADALIVEDDYDSEFRFEGQPIESMQGLDRHARVVYAGTFSKSLLPGLRIGYLILPETLVDPFLSAKSVWDGGTPMLEQAALATFLETGDYERHIRRMRRLYRARRDALIASLETAFGDRAQVGARQGGLNLLVTLRVPSTAEGVAGRAAAAGIGLSSATAYFETPPEHPTFLMGFASDERTIGEAVARLASVVAHQPVA